MKMMSLLFALLLTLNLSTSCAAATKDIPPSKSAKQSTAQQETVTARSADTTTPADENQNGDMLRINISVGDVVFEAQLLVNESTRALIEQLPMTLEMTDHAGQEKVIALPFELPPAATEKPDTIHAGELYLWSGNQLVLFYTSFANSYGGYVRLGAIEDANGLAEALGSSNVTVTIEQPRSKEDNILVAYFSCTGNTEQIAKLVAQHTGADLYPITPETPYTPKDLDYGNSSSRSSKEQNDPSARPLISGSVVENMANYDTVFLGYPIWWGQAPKIISTFLESYDLSGKTIVPFCTSGSSGVGSSDTNLHSLCADSVSWKQGERFSATASRETVTEWVDGLNIQTGSTSNVGVFNFKTKTVLLNSGYEMPIVGLGTYSLLDDVCVNSVSELLKAGGRLIDTAYMYHNEKNVGLAVRQSDVPREEIFITTKLYPNQFVSAEEAIEEALEKLDVGYIDLMLLHHPGTHDVDAYKAMEKAVEEGKIRSIGLSNWYVKELETFLPQISIMPAVVQNEIHPYYQENDVIPYIQQKGIVVEGWYPLGGRGHTAELLNNEVISEIARAHGKSSAQVILRWNLQKGVVVIPGSSNPDHIRENLDIFGFELTDAEMAKINGLDRNEKHDWY